MTSEDALMRQVAFRIGLIPIIDDWVTGCGKESTIHNRIVKHAAVFGVDDQQLWRLVSSIPRQP